MKQKKYDKSEFDNLVRDIQYKLDNEAKTIFSQKVIDEFESPHHIGRLKDADAVGVITGPCGDTMEFYLRINGNKVSDVRFVTDGCAPTIACGSMLTKLILNKTFKEVSQITNNDLINALDGLPEENLHCAKLAVDTMQKALENYLIEKEKRYL